MKGMEDKSFISTFMAQQVRHTEESMKNKFFISTIMTQQVRHAEESMKKNREPSRTARVFFSYVLTYLMVVLILTGMLVLVARIPREAIRENVERSAEYYHENEKNLFPLLFRRVTGSELDYYADEILLSIAYYLEEEHPLSSAMEAMHYHRAFGEGGMYEAVTKGKSPNQQYLRYWHGSVVFLRPLLLVFHVRQIYLFHAVLMAVLLILLCWRLFSMKEYVAMAAVLLAYFLVLGFVSPFCLEYTWTMLLMLIVSCGIVFRKSGGEKEIPVRLFFVVGMLTNYLDFLTSETISLLVPLLLCLWLGRKDGEYKTRRFGMIKAIVLWGIGYALMWVSKWGLAAWVLKKDVMPYITSHVEERLGGDIGIGLGSYLLGSVTRNVKCLLPFGMGTAGIVAGCLLLAVCGWILFVYHKMDVPWKEIGLYAVIGILPYVRYLVLHNHAYIHCFFTFRAQMAGVMALVFILAETVEWRWFFRADKTRGRT